MEQYAVKTADRPLTIEVDVPGSKSMTNRALLMAAMADGTSILRGALFSDDSEYFIQALKDLGFPVQINQEKKCIRILGQGGKIPNKEASIYVGGAGTAARFLTAFLAMGDGTYQIDSSGQMKKRPMEELLKALEQLGAKISYYGKAYTFPMAICGIGGKENIREASVSLNIDRSSQFLSSLLMTAPLCFPSLSIELTGSRNARSYVEMTEQMMKQFGHPGVIRKGKDCYEVMAGNYQAQDYQIEPDVSAACYFYAMAAVTGGRAIVRHMREDSLQGDRKFLDVLVEMGCTLLWENGQLCLQGPANGNLHGITASFSDFSDQALTMAAIAPYADAPVTIEGIAHTRGQETDRIAAIHSALHSLGIHCEETAGSITIYPGKIRGAEIETYDDHRVAMAFSITGLRTPGIIIRNPSCCKKTFPEYFSVMDSLLP